jgi:hypothetical protein
LRKCSDISLVLTISISKKNHGNRRPHDKSHVQIQMDSVIYCTSFSVKLALDRPAKCNPLMITGAIIDFGLPGELHVTSVFCRNHNKLNQL